MAARPRVARAVTGLVLAAAVVSSCASGHQRLPAAAPAPVLSAPPETTTPPSTTVDPGSLPQTTQLPSAGDPAFRQRMSDLWSAIVSGNPAEAMPAFFPLNAYVQVKAIPDPVHDYQSRLIAGFDRDIMSLHSQIGGSATFASVSVPDAARWIVPGVEYNKGSYWRVYGARVAYDVFGQTRYFTVASMISWRGEWYVVHLLSIR